MDSRSRAIELRKFMSIEEKVAQMMQISFSTVSKKEALVFAKMGVGSFLHVLGDDAREIQEAAMESRLSIPVLFGIDAIHGHALNDRSTIYPSCLGMAATFDRDLVRDVAVATAREVAEDGLHWTFSPLLCLGRDLRWGRINETFGEDPYLTGEMASAMIKGYQHDGSLSDDDAILACAKHFVGYGESTGGRDSYDAPVPLRQMFSVFLPPFKKAVDAGVGSVMAGYQSIDGVPCSANKFVLKDLLDNYLGFKGFVVTDWENVRSLIDKQFVAENIYEASYKAVVSGNHMIMNTPEFYSATVDLVKAGILDEGLIDDAVDRILKVKFDLGLMDGKKVETLSSKGKTERYIGCKEHEDLNFEVTKRSMVLLKNDGILPIIKDGKGPERILLVGPHGDDVMNMLGDWTFFTHPVPNPKAVPKARTVTLKQALEDMGKKYNFDVYYDKVCECDELKAGDLKYAIRKAQTSDLVILALGDNIDQTGEQKDRANIALPNGQMELFNALLDVGTPMITVLVSSKPMDIYDVNKFSSAVLYGFNWGSIGGEVAAKIITGEICPSGKLPISFPRHTGQLPVYYNYLPGWHGGKYMDYHQSPLYPLGHGLSYGKVSYSDLNVDCNYQVPEEVEHEIERLMKKLENKGFDYEGKFINVSVNVKNQSDFEVEEVVLLFVNDMVSSVLTPVRELKEFTRIKLAAKEEKKVEFRIPLSDLCIIDENLDKVFEHGEFCFMIDELESVVRL